MLSRYLLVSFMVIQQCTALLELQAMQGNRSVLCCSRSLPLPPNPYLWGSSLERHVLKASVLTLWLLLWQP